MRRTQFDSDPKFGGVCDPAALRKRNAMKLDCLALRRDEPAGRGCLVIRPLNLEGRIGDRSHSLVATMKYQRIMADPRTSIRRIVGVFGLEQH